MKKKGIIIALFIVFILGVVGYFVGRKLYWDYRIKHAIIHVEVSETPLLVFQKDIKVSDVLTEINGELKTNPVIDTSGIGKRQVTFKYINEENLPLEYTIEVEVVDKTPPLIFQGKTKKIPSNYDSEIEMDLFCGDNYDPNPTCTIEGEYDVTTPGTYPVTLVGVDSSGNKSTNDFNLIVYKPVSSSGGGSTSHDYVDFQTVRETYKGENVHFGIDISHWQEDIDFQRVKEAGVEFAYIRIGRGNGIGKEFVEDRKFEQNLKGFNEVGIPIGAYFYSYANSKEDARKEATWLLERIKKYKVDLEIAFDWENWQDIQYYDMSFHDLTEAAREFNRTVKKAGYTGMLYSSKSYLLSVWEEVDFPVWLAHYTTQTDYQGPYVVWQLCSNGRVPGINGDVDLNIRYGDLTTKK